MGALGPRPQHTGQSGVVRQVVFESLGKGACSKGRAPFLCFELEGMAAAGMAYNRVCVLEETAALSDGPRFCVSSMRIHFSLDLSVSVQASLYVAYDVDGIRNAAHELGPVSLLDTTRQNVVE